MAKFEINGDSHSARTIEADTYGQQDGYFHFVDESKQRVLSISTSHVITIERLQG
jgi:hypothetical protein